MLHAKGNLSLLNPPYFCFRYNNNHVSPTELEGILQRHPAIQESLVFGRPNPETQEQVTAVVVLKPGHEVK